MTNKEKAIALNVAIQAADIHATIANVTENYIQHHPHVPTGKDGLRQLVTKIKAKEIPAPRITNIRILQDADYVILHNDLYWPNRKSMFEIFRFEDGLAGEHWSGTQDYPATTANGHTMLDGATEITDRQLTDANKTFARSFVDTVLIKGAFHKFAEYLHADLIQHNPLFDNGIAGLAAGIEALTKKGVSIQFNEIVYVFGEGNFVLVCSEGSVAGKPTAFFDLFRIAGGKIVEHWDVLQEIPSPETSANRNGLLKAYFVTA